MKDAQIQRLLTARQGPIKAILFTRGGWQAADLILIEEAWHVPYDEPVIWKISTYTANGTHLRDVFVESETIAGISVERSTPHAYTSGDPPHIADGGY